LSLKILKDCRLDRTIYYMGLKIAQGFVFLSNRQTNAGVDNIVRYKKTFTWGVPGERAVTILMAGNLSITLGRYHPAGTGHLTCPV